MTEIGAGAPLPSREARWATAGSAEDSSKGRRVLAHAAGILLLVKGPQQPTRLLRIGALVAVQRVDPECIVERTPAHVEDRLLRGSHRDLAVAQDLLRCSLGLLHDAVMRHHARDEVALEGPLGVDR